MVCFLGAATSLQEAAAEEAAWLQLASSQTPIANAKSLKDNELESARGAGLDASPTLTGEDDQGLAVILWDDLKRSGNSGSTKTSLSQNHNVSTSITSSIVGRTR